jgi:hypothetical protein
MPPEVRGTTLELVERFAIAGSYKNILTMQPTKQLSSHPEKGESSGAASAGRSSTPRRAFGRCAGAFSPRAFRLST